MRVSGAIVCVVLLATVASNIEGQRRGGGSISRSGGGQINRSATSTSIRSNQTVNRNVDRNTDINRNVNVNRDINSDIDVHRNVDVGLDYDRWGHPVARGVAAGVAFGATVAMLPSGCNTVVVGGIGYSQCGSTWYEPYYSGTTVQYVVVMPPNQ